MFFIPGIGFAGDKTAMVFCGQCREYFEISVWSHKNVKRLHGMSDRGEIKCDSCALKKGKENDPRAR